MKEIPFIKMHGAGNDYVYIDGYRQQVAEPERLALAISDRHKGVGSDGLVLLLPSKVADCRMQMFNADGSEGRMCGNAIRCVGKLAFERGYVKDERLTVETLSGIKTLYLTTELDEVKYVTVEMGKAAFYTASLPMISDESTWINLPLNVGDDTYHGTAVSMGNPHFVIFVDNVEDLPLADIGPSIEHHHLFPDRVNTEFVALIDERSIRMRVWERGAGETMACGTGACAAVAAAVKNGYLAAEEQITVHLLGGDLQIICHADYEIEMKGEALIVAEGIYYGM